MSEPSEGRRGVDPDDLRQAHVFRELDDEELARLSLWFAELRIPSDHPVIRQGEGAEAFYVVRHGGVAVFRDAVGDPVELLARLGPGDFFGELGIFGIGDRIATVRSTEESVLLRISRRDLLDFLERHPAIERKLLSTASSRYTRHMAATLELARRREVRVRFRHPVLLRLDDDERTLEASLQNLSIGGLSLEGAPPEWQVDTVHRFGLDLEAGVLDLTGRVTWRRDSRIGMVFVDTQRNHDMLIQLTIRMLLETAS